jgi:YfiH family protein
MHFELQHLGTWSYYHVPEVTGAGIVHGFFTKASPPSVLRGDERKSFLHAFGLKDAIIMDQEHGDTCHVVENGERPKSGDGIILLEENVAGIIKTADCLPVVLCVPGLALAAIVHAGWRGTVKMIVRKTVDKMVDLGADISKMVALLGPSIGACCYEVKGDVYAVFKEQGFPENVFRKDNETLFLDLKGANRLVLEAAGVKSIYDTGLCTCCNVSRFASYRRGDRAHRQLSFVSLRG